MREWWNKWGDTVKLFFSILLTTIFVILRFFDTGSDLRFWKTDNLEKAIDIYNLI